MTCDTPSDSIQAHLGHCIHRLFPCCVCFCSLVTRHTGLDLTDTHCGKVAFITIWFDFFTCQKPYVAEMSRMWHVIQQVIPFNVQAYFFICVSKVTVLIFDMSLEYSIAVLALCVILIHFERQDLNIYYFVNNSWVVSFPVQFIYNMKNYPQIHPYYPLLCSELTQVPEKLVSDIGQNTELSDSEHMIMMKLDGYPKILISQWVSKISCSMLHISHDALIAWPISFCITLKPPNFIPI